MADGIDWGDVAIQATPALTTLLSVGATNYDLEQRTEATLNTMDSAINTFIYGQDVAYSQMEELDRAVGDKMTERGMEALMAESRLRAASAETGTTGGTTETAVKDAYMQQSLDNAVTIRNARTSKVSILRQMESDTLGLNNRLESLASGLATPTGAALQAGSSALSGFSTGLNFLNVSQKEQFFNIG